MRLSGRQGRRGARASRVLGGLAAAAIALGLEFGPAAPAAGAEQTGLETDEVEHLAFDGDLKDATSNGLDGSLVGGQEAYVAGTKGKALKLDGKQHVSLGTSTKLQPSSLTLSFWIDPNAPMKGEQILSWSKGTYTEPGWYVSTNDDHGITLHGCRRHAGRVLRQRGPRTGHAGGQLDARGRDL